MVLMWEFPRGIQHSIDRHRPQTHTIMSDLVRRTDLEFVAQLDNFSRKLPAYATSLGLTAEEIRSTAVDARFMARAVSGSVQARTYAQGWTNLKNLARGGGADTLPSLPVPVSFEGDPSMPAPGIELRFRALVRRIKSSPAYTVGTGEDLGIHADEDTTVITAPELRARIEGGNPVISFKKGKSDGIRLYSRRGGETAFTFLAVDTRSPYVDTRPNLEDSAAEKRDYYAYHILDDEQVGERSAIITITT
jgi:hypothetical protein